MSGAELRRAAAGGRPACTPATLNLLENPACAATRSRRRWPRWPRRAAPARHRGHGGARCRQVDAAVGPGSRVAGRPGARSPCWPWTLRPGGRAARCSATDRDRGRSRDRGVFIRSMACGRRAIRRARPGHPHRRAGAGGGLRRGGDRDGRCWAVGDRSGRGGRQRRRRRPARVRRRAAVPEGRHHGGPRRAGGDQGRSGPGRRARTAGPDAALRSSASATCRWSPSPSLPPGKRHRGAVAALDAHRAGPTSRPPGCARRPGALADFTAEHGERGLRALGGRARPGPGCRSRTRPRRSRAPARARGPRRQRLSLRGFERSALRPRRPARWSILVGAVRAGIGDPASRGCSRASRRPRRRPCHGRGGGP